MSNSSNVLEFHLFADDTNLFLADSNILNLETKLIIELAKVNQWLNANKLSLNIDMNTNKHEFPTSFNQSNCKTSQVKSSQVNFIYIVPNHNRSCLKTLYI